MKDFYMVNYKVRGIKTLDEMVSLSFYKKTITYPIDTQDYNVKGIYGVNGSGKSGIVTSVDILKNILIDENYLTNPIVQKNLDALINKKINELSIEVEYLMKFKENEIGLYQYSMTLNKGLNGKYTIGSEKFGRKKANSRKERFDHLIEVNKGEIINIQPGILAKEFTKRTANLLSTASIASLFVEKILLSEKLEFVKELNLEDKDEYIFFSSLLALFMFGEKIFVYMDQSDNHTGFYLNNVFTMVADSDKSETVLSPLISAAFSMDKDYLNVFSPETKRISKVAYKNYERSVKKLEEFIQIFKSDLKRIDIDRKEDESEYICSLVMVYDSYSIDAEFESTGIKKLIKLFAYLKEMVHGGIVFIDEFDSNLHDVYLCALMEYLMEYGEGQLCFTTHNVGPMDILKQHKKSIDFLSIDHKIYPWTTNGNYSPSKLYRNGMIEGSPFNIDSIDFIGIFDTPEEDRE